MARDGWGERSSYAVIDCGPHGSSSGTHAHADALSFEFSSGGHAWIVDPGTACVAEGRVARDACRLSAAHNTVVVNGRSQSEPAGSKGWATEAQCEPHELVDAGGAVLFRGSHDGYGRLKNPVTHSRTMLMVRGDETLGLPGYLVLVDALRGEGLHGFTLRMQLGGGTASPVGRHRVEVDMCGEPLAVECHGRFVTRSRVERGWVSRCYGAREEAPVAVFDASGVGPGQLVSFVMPGASGRTVFRVEPQSVDRGHAFVIESGSARDMLVVEDLRGATAGGVPRETLLWARFVGGRITSVLRVEGDGPPGPALTEEPAGRVETAAGHVRARPAGHD